MGTDNNNKKVLVSPSSPQRQSRTPRVAQRQQLPTPGRGSGGDVPAAAPKAPPVVTLPLSLLPSHRPSSPSSSSSLAAAPSFAAASLAPPHRGPDARFRCTVEYCDYSTRRKGDVVRHLAYVHGQGVEWYECPETNCVYRAKRKGGIKQHLANVHNIGVVWHQCSKCEYRAKKKSHLTRHVRSLHPCRRQSLSRSPPLGARKNMSANGRSESSNLGNYNQAVADNNNNNNNNNELSTTTAVTTTDSSRVTQQYVSSSPSATDVEKKRRSSPRKRTSSKSSSSK